MSASPLRAGAAAIDITPEIGVSLAGSLTARFATSIQDALHGRAVVIENETTKLVFVLVDLIALYDSDTQPVREAIGAALDIPAHHVCVSCTHTHFAPGTLNLFDTPREAKYLQWVRERLVQVALTAHENKQLARVAWGIGEEGRPQFNRRRHLRNGTVQMNPGQRPDLMHASGPTDPQVPLLLLQSLGGEAIAVIANYSLHYIGDCDGLAVSSDYFGRFAEIVAQRHGADCVALLTHGASGDINNGNYAGVPEPWYPEKMEPMQKSRIIAGMIADQVDAVWNAASWQESAELAAVEDVYQLGVRKISGEQIAQAEAEWADESLPIIERFYARERLELLNYPDTTPQIVQSLRVGEWGAATMTGEIFCRLGLDLKYASPFPVTALIELANGYACYVPTCADHVLGGYETWLARSAYAKPGDGENMVAMAAQQLRGLWQSGQPVPEAPRQEVAVS